MGPSKNYIYIYIYIQFKISMNIYIYIYIYKKFHPIYEALVEYEYINLEYTS